MKLKYYMQTGVVALIAATHRCVLYGYMGRPLQCEWLGARCYAVGKYATRREHTSFREGS